MKTENWKLNIDGVLPSYVQSLNEVSEAERYRFCSELPAHIAKAAAERSASSN